MKNVFTILWPFYGEKSINIYNEATIIGYKTNPFVGYIESAIWFGYVWKEFFFSIFSELTIQTGRDSDDSPVDFGIFRTYPASSLIFSATSIGPIGYDGKVMETPSESVWFPIRTWRQGVALLGPVLSMRTGGSEKSRTEWLEQRRQEEKVEYPYGLLGVKNLQDRFWWCSFLFLMIFDDFEWCFVIFDSVKMFEAYQAIFTTPHGACSCSWRYHDYPVDFRVPNFQTHL